MAAPANQETNVPYLFNAPLTVTGLTNTAFRFVGATSGGAPTSPGSTQFAAGDVAVDLTGNWWVCSTAGVPGTWVNQNAAAGSTTSGRFLVPPVFYQPASSTTFTNGGGGTLVAVASGSIYTGTFTAPTSGSVIVTAAFDYGCSQTASAIAWGLCPTGTTSPVVGNTIVTHAAIAAVSFAQTLVFPLGGLSGTYCLDVMWAIQTVGTGSVNAFGGTATNPAFTGGPAVVTVLAV
jgi:hypothetical protein